MESIRICKVENCEKITGAGRRVCYMHKERFKKYKSYNLPEKPKLPEGILKNCKIHGYRTIEQVTFHVHGSTYCLECKKDYVKRNKDKIKEYNRKTRERRQEWINKDRLKNPEKWKNYAFTERERNLEKYQIRSVLREKNITFDEYEKLVKKSQGKCAICKNPEISSNGINGRIRRLALDHCHKTGKIRDLLCNNCNIGLGKFKDDLELLKSAIEYLEKHKHD